MDRIKHLASLTKKIDRFCKEPIEFIVAFYNESWRCAYGWHEAYDGWYDVPFLSASDQELERALDLLTTIADEFSLNIDQFMTRHKPYDFSVNKAKIAELGCLDINGSRTLGIICHNATHIKRGNAHPRGDMLRWRVNGHLNLGAFDAVIGRFWLDA